MQRRRQPRRAVQLWQRLPGAGQGGRGRVGVDPPCPGGNEHAAWPICSRRSSGRATGSRSSARSTIFLKGSRLAVSTNLLASLITLMMRATGQVPNLTGPLGPEESKVVVARAILGEWLGGSGGGWQDSGGIFPGIKLIEGVSAASGDPEWGVSRGRLLPSHRLLNRCEGNGAHSEPAAETTQLSLPEALAKSLVVVHGGMAQNVGPILNMVTTKYLLRDREAWVARLESLRIFDDLVAAVEAADVRAIGQCTTRNWEGPLETDHPVGHQSVHRVDHPPGPRVPG